MALQSSGQIKLSEIRAELGYTSSNVSLGGMSFVAGFSRQDAMSEFYGYSHSSLTEVTLGTKNASSFGACINGGSNTTNYFADDTVGVGTRLYTSATGNVAASAGYYHSNDQLDRAYRVTGSSGLITSYSNC